MTGEHLIQFAAKLATSTDSVALRTAIGRAYYGALHISLRFLTDVGCPVATNDHGEPIRRLTVSAVGDVELAGPMLSDLQGERIRADYKLVDRLAEEPENVRRQVEIASAVRDLLAKSNKPELRVEIKAAIDAYLVKRGV